MQYCEVSDPSTICSCPDGSSRTEFQAGVAPSSFVFPLSDLEGYTLYCVQSVGKYREIPGRTVAGGEITPGQGRADEASRTQGEETAVHAWADLF